MHGGDIRFEGEINGHPVHMLLDDGYMWDPLLFWGSPKIDSFGFDFDGDIFIGDEGSDSSDMVPARTASGITISFSGVEFIDQTALITSYSSGNAGMWAGSVGQVSCTFLKHFVVDINFDRMMIRLIEPDKFEYSGSGRAIDWKPLGFGPWSIPATLRLTDGLTWWLRREKCCGGVCRERTIRPDDQWVMVGLGLLSRFNLVFDYTRQRLFVEPNKSFGNEF